MNNLYAIMIALLPFISQYKMPIIQKNAGLIVICLMALMVIINRVNLTAGIDKIYGIYRLFFFYIIINLLISAWMGNISLPYIISHGLLSIVIFVPALNMAIENVFNMALVRSIIEKISILASILLLVQYISYYFMGITLCNGAISIFTPFPQLLEIYSSYGSKSLVVNGLFRPAAFFLEPSHFSQYVTIGLLSILFNEKPVRRRYLYAALLSIATILTTSGQGILYVFFIWIYFTIVQFRTRRTLRVIIISLVLGSAAWMILSKIDVVQQSVGRFINVEDGKENAFEGRQYTKYFLETLNEMEVIWGKGYQNVPKYTGSYRNGMTYYMVGYVEVLYCLGVVGLFVIVLINAITFFNIHGFYRGVLLMYCGYFVGAGLVSNMRIVFFYSIILYGIGVTKADNGFIEYEDAG